MKNKLRNVLTSILFGVFLLGSVSVVAEENVKNGYVELNVSSDDIEEIGAYGAIQSALNEAAANATEKLPYKVIVEEGKYTLSQTLHIYSNTYLLMDGVSLKQTKGIKKNQIKVGGTSDSTDGYYYKNVTIDGGIWDSNGNNGTALKIGHAENVTIMNATVKNVANAHLMEVAGVNKFTVKNSSFSKQRNTSKKGVYYEAIQLDVLVQSHFTGYKSEDLPMKDVVIDNCTFTDVPRGVGSHTAVLNNPVNNIQITNCTFKNNESVAIQGLNWTNCTISGNKISGSPRGVALYTIDNSGTFLASTLAKEGGVSTKTSTKYKKPSENQNIVIKDNQITCGGTDPYASYAEVGILVSGLKLNSATKSGDGNKIPKGSYYMSGVTISGNMISSIGHGIRVIETKGSVIKNNVITYKGKKKPKEAFYGIQLRENCSKGEIIGNVIRQSNSNGIYIIENSTATKISDNDISSAGKHGIYVEKGVVSTISGNTISKCANDLICLRPVSEKKKITVKNNKFIGTKNTTINGIYVAGGYVELSENVFSKTNKPIVVESNVKAIIEPNTFKNNKYNGTMYGNDVYVPVSAPKNVKATKKSKTSITISWKKVSKVGGYIIYRSSSKNGEYKKCATISSANTTKYVDKKLGKGKKYYYKVAVFSKSGNKKVEFRGKTSKVVSVKL